MSFESNPHHMAPCTCDRAAGDSAGKHRCPQYNEKCEATATISSSRSGRESLVEMYDGDDGEYVNCSISQVESQFSIPSSGNTLCQAGPEASGQGPAMTTQAMAAALPFHQDHSPVDGVLTKMPSISIAEAAGNNHSAMPTADAGTRLTQDGLALHTMVQNSLSGHADFVYAYLRNANGAAGMPRDHLPLPPSDKPSLQTSPDGSSRSSASISAEFCPADDANADIALACAGIWADEPLRYFTLDELSAMLNM